MTCTDILALSSVDAREWARHTTDLELLREVRDAASADTERPRRTLLAAVDFRLGALAKLAEEVDVEAVRDDAAPVEVAPVVESEAAEPDVDVTACAQAFVAALRSGDAALVAAMIADVRRQDIATDAMADALVSAFVASAPTGANRAPRAERVPRIKSDAPASPMSERFALALQHGTTAPDGTVTLDGEAMTLAGFPASWRTASLWHITYGSARQAARRFGLEGEFRGGILTLRRNEVATAA